MSSQSWHVLKNILNIRKLILHSKFTQINIKKNELTNQFIQVKTNQWTRMEEDKQLHYKLHHRSYNTNNGIMHWPETFLYSLEKCWILQGTILQLHGGKLPKIM